MKGDEVREVLVQMVKVHNFDLNLILRLLLLPGLVNRLCLRQIEHHILKLVLVSFLEPGLAYRSLRRRPLAAMKFSLEGGRDAHISLEVVLVQTVLDINVFHSVLLYDLLWFLAESVAAFELEVSPSNLLVVADVDELVFRPLDLLGDLAFFNLLSHEALQCVECLSFVAITQPRVHLVKAFLRHEHLPVPIPSEDR